MSGDIKTDIPGLYKSPDGFLINKDNASLTAYRARKSKDKEIEKMKEDVDSLKNDIQEIKNMLKKVLE